MCTALSYHILTIIIMLSRTVCHYVTLLCYLHSADVQCPDTIIPIGIIIIMIMSSVL